MNRKISASSQPYKHKEIHLRLRLGEPQYRRHAPMASVSGCKRCNCYCWCRWFYWRAFGAFPIPPPSASLPIAEVRRFTAASAAVAEDAC